MVGYIQKNTKKKLENCIKKIIFFFWQLYKKFTNLKTIPSIVPLLLVSGTTAKASLQCCFSAGGWWRRGSCRHRCFFLSSAFASASTSPCKGWTLRWPTWSGVRRPSGECYRCSGSMIVWYYVCSYLVKNINVKSRERRKKRDGNILERRGHLSQIRYFCVWHKLYTYIYIYI